MRRHSISILVLSAAVAAGAALIADDGQPGGQGQTADQQAQGQGRGRGRSGWVDIKDGEECPPGMTEARHLSCAPPASPAPSILDYRPRSTVVAEEHLVPKAKFPVVDVHTHGTAAYINQPDRLKEMDAL